MILILSFSLCINSAHVPLYQGTLEILKPLPLDHSIIEQFIKKNQDESEIHDHYFRNYLDLLEKIDDMYDQQEKLLLFNEANIQYVMKKTKKNYNDQIAQLSQNLDQNNDQLSRVKKNLEESQSLQETMLSGILEISTTIQNTLKDNFSLNFQRIMPVLNQRLEADFFNQFQKLKTLDYQLLQKELERYKSFGQQVKESKKKELANCFTLISSVLKQAQVLLISEFQQIMMEQNTKIIILREENKVLQSKILQLKRLKRLVEDSQEFKQTLIKQYKENIKFTQNKKAQFREMAKNFIETNQAISKYQKNECNSIQLYIQYK